MLVTHPDECIDCGVCEPECPGRGNLGRYRSSKDNPELDYWLKYNNSDHAEKTVGP